MKGRALNKNKHGGLHVKANLIAGILATIPILVVWFVLDFILAILFRVGAPTQGALTDTIGRVLPSVAPILTNPYFEWFVAIAVALLLLYTIGEAASHVFGNRLIAMFERLIDRIPGVQTVYSAVKMLVAALQKQPGSGAARIVLFDFPYPGVKVIGIVTRTMRDAHTGEEIAFVYLPTTPNPTSGFLEIVQVKNLILTDMTMDQAMTLIVSGGAITPEDFSMFPPAPGPVENSPSPSASAPPED